MGDFENNFDPLKKLGFFDTRSQWILYDDRFAKFFEFISDNITDVNMLNEHEALDFEEITNLHEFDVRQQQQTIEEYIPGLFEASEEQIAHYSNEVSVKTQAVQMYKTMIEDACECKNNSHKRLCKLEDDYCVLQAQEEELLTQCHSQAKQLELLQEGNKKLYKEARNCFTRLSTPPLLFHQFPLEEYFAKCDAFLQYFALYIQENYKFQNFMNIDNEERDHVVLSLKLKNLKTLTAQYSMKYLENVAKYKADRALIEEMDMRNIHSFALNDLELERRDLELLNEHHLNVAHKTLRSDVKCLVQNHAQQRIELVLYENTKHKLDRALKRLDNDKVLTKLTSDALSNAELIWIAIQLDLERSSNRIDNIRQLSADSQACWRRIKAMYSLDANILDNSRAIGFLENLSDILMKSSNVQSFSQHARACLHEYEKFGRLLSYSLQNMINGRAYVKCMDQLKEFKPVKAMLEPILYDSPIRAPLLCDLKQMSGIHEAKMNISEIDNHVREIRMNLQKHVEKMEKDPLWHDYQMLWVWFLEQPKRLIMAMDEVKRASSKSHGLTTVKNICGIKRK